MEWKWWVCYLKTVSHSKDSRVFACVEREATEHAQSELCFCVSIIRIIIAFLRIKLMRANHVY